MNLHGCAPRSSYSGGTPGSVVRPGVGRFTSLCPPFLLLRGYPSSAKLVLGRPPLLRRLRLAPKLFAQDVLLRGVDRRGRLAGPRGDEEDLAGVRDDVPRRVDAGEVGGHVGR